MSVGVGDQVTVGVGVGDQVTVGVGVGGGTLPVGVGVGDQVAVSVGVGGGTLPVGVGVDVPWLAPTRMPACTWKFVLAALPLTHWPRASCTWKFVDCREPPPPVSALHHRSKLGEDWARVTPTSAARSTRAIKLINSFLCGIIGPHMSGLGSSWLLPPALI